MTDESNEQADTGTEPLGWAAVGNVSVEATRRQYAGVKRPGTRHFVPGAKLWLLPAQWGDGWDDVYAVGTRRQTGGRKVIRTIIKSELLVNVRPQAVYRPTIWRSLTMPTHLGYDATPSMWEDLEEIEDFCQYVSVMTTQRCHVPSYGHPRLPLIHWEDENCAFCEGVDAEDLGISRDDNPHPHTEPTFITTDRPQTLAVGPAQLWDLGWATARQLSQRKGDPDRLDRNDHMLNVAVGTARIRVEMARATAPEVIGMPIDLAMLWANDVGIRVSIAINREPTRNLIGRIVVELDENDVVRTARAG